MSPKGRRNDNSEKAGELGSGSRDRRELDRRHSAVDQTFGFLIIFFFSSPLIRHSIFAFP